MMTIFCVNKRGHRSCLSRGIIITLSLLPPPALNASPLLISTQMDDEQRSVLPPLTTEQKKKNVRSWTIYFDNDGLAPGRRDRDYTGGLSFTLGGTWATDNALTLNPLLEKLDSWHRLDSDTIVLHGIEFGLTVFTPENIVTSIPLTDHRPYASLLYLGSGRQYIDANTGYSRISSLTFGILGLPLAQELQQDLHRLVDSEQPNGWDNQISDGGEPTLRYSVAWSNFLDANYSSNGIEYEIVTTHKLNLGYITDATWGLSTRIGRLETPWWSFSPQLAEYSEYSKPSVILPDHRAKELYLWAGFNFRARLYNVFLQGQFKDNPVTFNSDELNHLIGETWIGITGEFDEGWRASYFIRAQTSEIKSGPSNHNTLWSGFILGRTY